jgi:pimeloyl-ACP methyl ester carboxylesterase
MSRRKRAGETFTLMFTQLYSGLFEEARRCETPDGLLHVMLYRSGNPSGAALVIAPPDGEERSFAARSLVTTARALAAAGYTVLRFDYCGQGQSENDYEKTTLSTRVSNLTCVWKALRDEMGQSPAVLGVRLGGTIALAAAQEIPDLAEMILWDPVMDASAYLYQLLRINVSGQMIVNGRVLRERDELIADARAGRLISINGFHLSGPFVDDLLNFNARTLAERWNGRGLVLTRGAADAQTTAMPSSWSVARVQCPPFWRELKTHSAAPPAFLAPTLEFLRADSNAAREEC